MTSTSPVLPWKSKIFLSIGTVLLNTIMRSDGTVNRQLLKFLDSKTPATNKPIHGVITTDITVDPSRNLWFRIFTPISPDLSTTTLPVIIFFHGGCYVILGADSTNYDNVCRRIAREIPAIVVSVNYRLAPENRFPAQNDDGYDTLKFLDQMKPEDFPMNADLRRCFLAGDSAGANLVHHLVCRPGGLEFRTMTVIGLISIEAWFGGEDRTASEMRFEYDLVMPLKRTDLMWKAFLPEGESRDHPAVNVVGTKDVCDLSAVKFPATVILVAGFDPLQDRQREYYEWLKREGKAVELIEYPNTIHTFYMIPELPESSMFISDVRGFIEKQSSLCFTLATQE
ncbi:hypothetical protein NE237_017596 [Protea cynaroides]|uniref:Alpha/beta hydrolase fold-3 domain-containing protein n=1 Tax=Protea cynaroides TaxID=273540 RepID=A0A9Q0K8C5_9MAGN|nr:hypothetical protein NE237_017596 [Protea cynaroides]